MGHNKLGRARKESKHCKLDAAHTRQYTKRKIKRQGRQGLQQALTKTVSFTDPLPGNCQFQTGWKMQEHMVLSHKPCPAHATLSYLPISTNACAHITGCAEGSSTGTEGLMGSETLLTLFAPVLELWCPLTGSTQSLIQNMEVGETWGRKGW